MKFQFVIVIFNNGGQRLELEQKQGDESVETSNKRS